MKKTITPNESIHKLLLVGINPKSGDKRVCCTYTPFFDEKADKLSLWTDDLKSIMKTEINDMEAAIKQIPGDAQASLRFTW